MNDQGNTNWDPTKSITVPIFYFILVAVAVLTYFFGWWVLAVFLSLWVGAWLFAWFDDRRQIGKGGAAPAGSATGSASDSFLDADGNCSKCGGKVFVVEPGVTTMQTIIDFACTTDGWQENPEAVAGWMPPGVYCPRGCLNLHVTPIPTGLPDSGNAEISRKLGMFEDLLALIDKLGKQDDPYQAQDTFMAYYRRGKRRFLATMPLRSFFVCKVCNQQIGEAELHYEDPTQPVVPDQDAIAWGESVGAYCDIRRSQLHGVLEHDAPVPAALARLCDGIKV